MTSPLLEKAEKEGHEMKEEHKTKPTAVVGQQPTNELAEVRQRITEEKTDPERKREQAGDRLAKELTAITAVVHDMLRGEVDDAQTEKRVLNACLAATDSAYGMIGVINEHGKYDTTTYSSQTLQDCAFPEALAWEMSTGMTIRGIWGWPMLHGKPLICNDLQAHPDRVGLPQGHAPLRCFLGVPLKRDGKVVGMVAVANKPGGYTQVDRDTLIRLASVMSVSRQHRQEIIERKRAEAELRKHHEHLEELVDQRAAQIKRTNEELEAEVAERKRVGEELAQRVEELELFNRLAVGREFAKLLQVVQRLGPLGKLDQVQIEIVLATLRPRLDPLPGLVEPRYAARVVGDAHR